MRLDDTDARARLASHDHGILCTVHATRGVDAVPVVYALDEAHGHIGVRNLSRGLRHLFMRIG